MLSDIKPEGDCAVAAGHFGEIWKGVFRGRPVCMKVIKVYQTSDVEKLLKVYPFRSQHVYECDITFTSGLL